MSFKSKFKDVFKKIWMGYEAASPYVDLALSLIPGGGPAIGVTRKVVSVISKLVAKAEEVYPQAGSAADKIALVSTEALAELEHETGKNFNSPKGRALIERYRSIDVKLRDLKVELTATVQEIHDYVADVKDPANPNDDKDAEAVA